MNKKLKEYGIYNQDGELVDVLFLTNNQVKDYKKNNPDYLIEELDDLEEDDE